MPGKSQEIAADFLRVHRPMPGALRRVNQRDDAEPPGARAEIRRGIDRAKGVGNMREGKELHVFRQQLVQPAKSRRPSSPVTGRYDELAPVRSASNCHGTMLLWCSISVSRMVSPALRFFTPQVGHQIDPLGCAARKNDFVAPAGVEEAGRPRRAAS